LSGQICRCTGYANIVKAIVAAGQEFEPIKAPAGAAEPASEPVSPDQA
jgi:xanthine dehydrogenase iron-sulfur cluster and FAD-binding subunit A